MSSRSPRNVRSPLLWLTLPFATGVAVAHSLSRDSSLVLWLSLTGAALLGAFMAIRAHPRWWSGATLLALIGAGGMHYTMQRQHLPEWDQLPDREVYVEVKITRLFGDASDSRFQNLIGTITRARAPVGDLLGQPVHIRVRRPFERPDAIQRGATGRIVGQLTRISATETEDSFLRYLGDAGHNFRIQQARWLQTVEPPSRYAQARHRLKIRAGNSLVAGLGDQPAITGALRAMLLGERHTLPEESQSLFLRSGTMHLFAISGLHIGIIAIALNSILLIGRIPRIAAFLIGSFILLGYVDLIGLTPSAVRAWIMITCFHGARVLRAPSNSVAAISASALFVLLLDPMQLFSAGFQMSYAIVFVLLLYGVPLGEQIAPALRPWRDLPGPSLTRGQKRIQRYSKNVAGALALTWAASLIGIISGVGIFGWFSPLAFIANLVLVPLAGFTISAGFGCMVLGLIGVPSLAPIFNHAAGVILWLIFAILEYPLRLTAGFPAEFRAEWWGRFGMLAVLVTVVLTHERQGTHPNWRWWGPFIVMLLVLVTGLRFP